MMVAAAVYADPGSCVATIILIAIEILVGPIAGNRFAEQSRQNESQRDDCNRDGQKYQYGCFHSISLSRRLDQRTHFHCCV